MERRDFLKLGGLIIGFYAGGRQNASAAELRPSGWIRIDSNGEVTVLVENIDIGQGSWTGLAMLAAEELDADWMKIRVYEAPADRSVYKNMSTGGSGAITDGWDNLRRAGAQARGMLIDAAAARWNVTPESCRTADSRVAHEPTGRTLAYAALVDDAAKLMPPDPAKVPLKDAKNFRLVGKSMARADVPLKVDGSAQYGMDVRVPGMLYAVIARCPAFGGKAAQWNADRARAVPGVRDVFEIPPMPRIVNSAGGIVVLADTTWAAMEGRKALEITWDRGPHANESSENLRELAQEQLQGPATHVVGDRGNAEEALQGGAKVIEAVYELPFQPHASMEPMNCVADAHRDRIEFWTGTQWPLQIQTVVAPIAGIAPEKIVVHNQRSGGAFGRRGQWDYPVEAWQISKAAGKPVKLVWTREDDLQHDFYRPLSYHRLRATLDANGKPEAWVHRIVSTSIREVFDPPQRLQDPAEVARQEIHGAEVPYAIPKVRVDFAPLSSGVPRAWWRSVGSSFNAFAVECFIDELAASARRDPLAFRLELLRDESNARLRKVLEVAAEHAGWTKPAPLGCARGIAAHCSFGTYVAYVATVSKAPDGSIRVRNVVGAVDCGTAVHPDSVKMMIEGAVIYGLSATLEGEITVANGAVRESNFDGFRPLRMPESPAIDVHIVNSGGEIGGMGEPGVPPIAPAVANAVFALTGTRPRRLPINRRA